MFGLRDDVEEKLERFYAAEGAMNVRLYTATVGDGPASQVIAWCKIDPTAAMRIVKRCRCTSWKGEGVSLRGAIADAMSMIRS